MNNHTLFQVATKALVKKDGQYLVLERPDGKLDFPGGRIDEKEVGLPFSEALGRELTEECGDKLKVEILQTAFVSKRDYVADGKRHMIVAIYFECKYLEGDILLSSEHKKYNWMSAEDLPFDSDKYVSKDEYNQIVKYFKI